MASNPSMQTNRVQNGFCVLHKLGQMSHTQTHTHAQGDHEKNNTMWLTVSAPLCLVGWHSMASLLLFVSNLFLSLWALFLCYPWFKSLFLCHILTRHRLLSSVFHTLHYMLQSMYSGLSRWTSLSSLPTAPYISNTNTRTHTHIPVQMLRSVRSWWFTTQPLKSWLNPIHPQSIADKTLTDTASPLLLLTSSPLCLFSSHHDYAQWRGQ